MRLRADLFAEFFELSGRVLGLGDRAGLVGGVGGVIRGHHRGGVVIERGEYKGG